MKTRVRNRNYLSLVMINAWGKDCTPNGLGDEFSDLWFDDLVQAQAIRVSFLLESNHGFDRCLFCSSLTDCELTKESPSPLSCLLEQGLFEPERGEGQMAGQCQAKYAASVGTQLLAKIHVLHELSPWHAPAKVLKTRRWMHYGRHNIDYSRYSSLCREMSGMKINTL